MRCLAAILKALLCLCCLVILPFLLLADIFNIAVRYIYGLVRRRQNAFVGAVSGSFLASAVAVVAGIFFVINLNIR